MLTACPGVWLCQPGRSCTRNGGRARRSRGELRSL